MMLFAREIAGRLSATDGMVFLLGIVAFWGIHKSIKGQFFADPLNRGQGLALRGLFACVVMFCHLSDRVVGDNGLLFPRFNLWGAFAVSVFFGLSGYGLMVQTVMKPDYLDGFWAKRCRALLLPYLLVSTLAFLQWCRGDFALGYRLSKWLGIVHYGWFCTVLMSFYVVFWWANRQPGKSLGERLALTVAGVLFVTVLSAWTNLRGFHFESNGAFVVGLLLGANREKGCKLLRNFWAPLVAVTCVIVAIRMSWGMSRWLATGWRWHSIFFLHMVWFLGIVALSMKFQLGNRVLAWLGAFSYELYLVHGWVIDEIAHWWPDWKGSLCAWTVLGISLLLAWGVHESLAACWRRASTLHS